jgi:hypothetical protein
MHAFMLWQAYLQNVNPLSKLIYAPLVQELVVDASRDVSAVTLDSVALLFAIYAAAVMSWNNDECQSRMGESKKVLHDRYLAATQQALVAARFLNSVSLVALQGFAVFLVCICNDKLKDRTHPSRLQHGPVSTRKPSGF